KHQRHVDSRNDVWEPSTGQREAATQLNLIFQQDCLPNGEGLFREYEELQAKKKKRMKKFPLLKAKFQELNENAKASFELEKEAVKKMEGIRLVETEVTDRAVVVSTVAGITLKVLSVPVKAVTDKGSDMGTKTSQSADLCLVIFFLILRTLELETSNESDKAEAPTTR
nr:hypothetical protein [Tanacetum cinerariifolium]